MEEYLRKTIDLSTLAKEAIDMYTRDMCKYRGYLVTSEIKRFAQYSIDYTWLEWAKFMLLVCPDSDMLLNEKKLLEEILKDREDNLLKQYNCCDKI